MRYDDDERVASCQREIQRLRRVIWELEEEVKWQKTIVHNAINMWFEDSFYDYSDGEFKDRVIDQLEITEEEYKEIMGD